jgi:hypothetical protein
VIDPNRTAERATDAALKAIEEHGLVRDRILTAIRDVIAGEVAMAPVLDVVATNEMMRRNAEHYSPIPVPWDAVPLATKKGGA